jgi:hypothetical protein
MEKKGRTYQSSAQLESLSEEKRAKIKAYVKKHAGRLQSTSKAAIKDTTAPQAMNSNDGFPEPLQPTSVIDDADGALGDNPDSDDDASSGEESDDSQGEETDSGDEDVEMDTPVIREDNRMEVDV